MICQRRSVSSVASAKSIVSSSHMFQFLPKIARMMNNSDTASKTQVVWIWFSPVRKSKWWMWFLSGWKGERWCMIRVRLTRMVSKIGTVSTHIATIGAADILYSPGMRWYAFISQKRKTKVVSI